MWFSLQEGARQSQKEELFMVLFKRYHMDPQHPEEEKRWEQTSYEGFSQNGSCVLLEHVLMLETFTSCAARPLPPTGFSKPFRVASSALWGPTLTLGSPCSFDVSALILMMVYFDSLHSQQLCAKHLQAGSASLRNPLGRLPKVLCPLTRLEKLVLSYF